MRRGLLALCAVSVVAFGTTGCVPYRHYVVLKKRLEDALTHSHTLETVYQFKRRLQAIWQERSASHERLRQALQDWCRQAEESGIRALEDFARTLPSYTMQSA